MEELKLLIMESVQIQHLAPAEIQPETRLTTGGLGLDSVDILEVVVSVERKYGIKVRDAKTGQQYFQTIGTIADFVTQSL